MGSREKTKIELGEEGEKEREGICQIKSVSNRLSNQSERDTRIWYHKTAAFK